MNAALRERDLWLAGASALIAAVSLSLALAASRRSSDVATTPVVGSVKRSSGDVKLRLAMTLGWGGASRGVEVHDGDAVFVPPGAEATLSFNDGSELALDERSLVVIETPRAGVRSVTLRQGSLSGRAGTQGLTLQTPNGEARLAAQTEARVELTGKKLEVSVKKGSAQVQGGGATRTLEKGQRVAAAETGTEDLAPWSVTLDSPEAQAVLPFRATPAPISLTWQGAVEGARIQVARDRLFAFVDVDRAVQTNEFTIKEPARGVSWWRVVDRSGRPVSEARRFTCVEDVAPVAMFPRNGEVLLAPPGTNVAFAWTPLPGISKYRLEISPSQGFEPVSASFQVNGASTRQPLFLNEATWFWRVRADEESGAGASSVPLRFRVIHKGIPDAPELLNPEIEVTP
ncbi:MAG: hypothetical protein DI536_21745 [Archangium gephyra]|uniref:FecR protein domain-containing protein n=1 Tax=Archangium gephyra TaxID=48 RepID=A0A2W5TAX0_9BACT|nr:MAG: hypothetical protein DI536_21745 [Archangium gephyra]